MFKNRSKSKVMAQKVIIYTINSCDHFLKLKMAARNLFLKYFTRNSEKIYIIALKVLDYILVMRFKIKCLNSYHIIIFQQMFT